MAFFSFFPKKFLMDRESSLGYFSLVFYNEFRFDIAYK